MLSSHIGGSLLVLVSALPVIVGLGLMANCRVAFLDMFPRSVIPKYGPETAFYHGVISQIMFHVGLWAFALGLTSIAFSIGYPAALSLIVPFIIHATDIPFMFIKRTSIVGAPGFNAPPLGIVLLYPIVVSGLGLNAYIHWDEFNLNTPETVGLAALIIVPSLVVHALGAYHRQLGFCEKEVKKVFCPTSENGCKAD